MRSRADTARAGSEWMLRGLALALLAWALIDSLLPPAPRPSETVYGAALEPALERLSFTSLPAGIRLRLDSAPGPIVRDWLVALRRAGTPVAWSAERVEPLALAAEPLPEPRGAVALRVAARSGATVALGDENGAWDSARVASTGVALHGTLANRVAEAKVGLQYARTIVRDSLHLHPVLVLASAGWEGKFVVAALEEEGWFVDARLSVAPGIEVRQGDLAAIDTTHYSALIVLDSVAARPFGQSIARYVRSGGGLILAGSAVGLAALRSLLPGELAASRASSPAARDDTVTLATLPLAPIVALRADALALERRNAVVAVAVRRIAAGRAALSGYADSWRWRLGGGADAVAAHRKWWSALVATVAYAPATPITSANAPPTRGVESDAAPIAHLFDALGPPFRSDEGVPPGALTWWRGPVTWWLPFLLFAALITEWASRRLRGVR